MTTDTPLADAVVWELEQLDCRSTASGQSLIARARQLDALQAPDIDSRSVFHMAARDLANDLQMVQASLPPHRMSQALNDAIRDRQAVMAQLVRARTAPVVPVGVTR